MQMATNCRGDNKPRWGPPVNLICDAPPVAPLDSAV
jgi:hypothetical protein